jgi:hypothetical protein
MTTVINATVAGLRGPGLTATERALITELAGQATAAADSYNNLASFERANYVMEKGFYDVVGNPSTDTNFNAWRRVKFAVMTGETLLITTTINGSGLGVYGFYDANGTYIGAQLPGDGSTHTYTDPEVVAPSNAAAIQVNGYEKTPFLVQRRSHPSNDRLDALIDSQRVWQSVGTRIPGYAGYTDGAINTGVLGYETIVYQVQGPATFRHTSRVQGGVVAARVFRDETGAYAGYQLQGTNDPVDYALTDRASQFDVPGGVGTILITGKTADGYPLQLQQLVESATVGADASAAINALTGPTALALTITQGFYSLTYQTVNPNFSDWKTAFISVTPGQVYDIDLVISGGDTAAVVFLNSSGGYVDKLGQCTDNDQPFKQSATIPAGVAGLRLSGKSYAPLKAGRVEL